MLFRVLSDLHNFKGRNDLPVYNDEVFTIICGDISADKDLAFEWIDNNVKQGILVEGNHIGYESKHSIQFLEQRYVEKYPLTTDISYLRNNYKVIGDYVFVGGILWTDLKFNGPVDLNKYLVKMEMNDFKYNIVNTKNYYYNKKIEYKKDKVLLTPEHWIDMFNLTFSRIIKVCQDFPDKKIIVVTHHAPSGASIHKTYVGCRTNSGFASELSDFILNHPNIKMWCHGHIHQASDYMIGDCRVINNPVGYPRQRTGFKKDLIIEI